jgi:PHD-finger
MEPKEALQPSRCMHDKTVKLPTVEDDSESDENVEGSDKLHVAGGVSRCYLVDESDLQSSEKMLMTIQAVLATTKTSMPTTKDIQSNSCRRFLQGDESLDCSDSSPLRYDQGNDDCCIDVVEQYVRSNSFSSSGYRILWSKEDYAEEHVELRKVSRRKRRHSSLCHHFPPTCTTLVEFNDSDWWQNDDSGVKFKPPSTYRRRIGSVRIGSDYQAYVSSKVSTNRFKARSIDYGHVLMWDPCKAKYAKSCGEDIESFLSVGDNLNVKWFLMAALHQGNYNLAAARNFIARFDQLTRYSIMNGDHEIFRIFFTGDQFAKTKNFKAISQSLGCPLEPVLINYYRWKKSKQNNPKQYLQMKKERKKESDACEVCGEGGKLIVCDLCRKSYHRTCLQPILKLIPKGEWFCSRCEARSPAKLRRHSGYNKMDTSPICESYSRGVATVGMLQSHGVRCVKALPSKRLASLKLIHKELSMCFKKPKIHSETEPSLKVNVKPKEVPYVPSDMTWDARGYWVQSEVPKYYGTCSPNGSKNDEEVCADKLMTPIDSNSDNEEDKDDSPYVNGSHSSSDDSEVDSKVVGTEPCFLSTKHSALARVTAISFNQPTVPSLKNPALPVPVREPNLSFPEESVRSRGRIYEAILPITSEGLLIFIQNHSEGGTQFSGYRPTMSGEVGPAEKNQTFMAEGDFILEIDMVPCTNKSFAEVKAILTTQNSGVPCRLLKMYHPL